MAYSRKRPGGSKLLPFIEDGSQCANWDNAAERDRVNAAEMFLYPSSDLCLDTLLSQRSIDNSLYLFLVLALSTVGPYIDMPFQIMDD